MSMQDLPAGAIAVIGMACRYPGAASLAQLWENLLGGVESIRFFSEAELLAAGVSAEQLARPNYVRAAGVLDDIAGFDAALFGISAREAQVLDPQQRVFLECCWAALEDASIDPSRSESRVGVFAGCNLSSYALLQQQALTGDDTGAYMEALVGNDKDYLSTRVSYRLNLRGPSVSVGTACSTSLAAIALACQSLQAVACDAVLAGGVCINVPQERGYLYGEGGDALSLDGHCRAFDAAASGTAPGYGAGVVVLKRLEDACADNDPIYAVIRGYALNNDGRDKVGYWAPSVSGHAEVVSEALELAGFSARDISYVEAHGTGTPMGDPIEIAALSSAFRADTRDRGYCAIGSVKSNIGHTSQAAGVAGLIKTVLALHHAQLPPSLHFERPNPKLQLEQSPFFVNTEARPWQGVRRAGVSSLGLGGTNVHVVLEQAPPQPCAAQTGPVLLPLSANSEAALDASAARLLAHLERQPELSLTSVASALARGRRQLPVRAYLVARDLRHACEQLEGRSRARWMRRASEQPRPVVFVFPGASSVDLPALRGLAAHFPVLRELLAAGVEEARALDLDLRCLLSDDAPTFAADGGERGADLPRGFAALLVVEVTLARFLQRAGLQPAAVLGHSSGEYAAAVVSGALSLSAALRLQSGRARLLAGLPRRGAMLSVNLPEAEIERRLGHPVSVAAHNADDVTLLSGDADQLADWAQRLSGPDVVCRPSSVLGAAHSSFVDPILEPLRALAAGVQSAAPALPWISTLSGERVSAAPSGEHWVRHTREGVRFVQAVASAAQEDALFLEVGPGGHLTSLIQRILRTRGLSNAAFSSMPGPKTDAAEYLLAQSGRMWALGVSLDLVELCQTRGVTPARLPSYPFEHVPHWIGQALPRTAAGGVAHAQGTITDTQAGPYLYRPVWVKSPLPSEQAEPRAWVLLSDGCALCDELERLAGREGRAFTRVACGTAKGSVDPRSASSLCSLFETLRERHKDGFQLLRCLAGGAPDDVLDEPAALARGLKDSGYESPLAWVLLTSEAQPVLGGERTHAAAAVSSMAVAVRVLPRELPQLQARWLDVDLAALGDACGRTAQRIADELHAPVTFPDVAFRHGQRWQRELRLLPSGSPRTEPLCAGGRYLITGGLGRMGLSLATYLSELRDVRIALVHTRELPPRERWAELASEQAEIGSTGQILSSLLKLGAAGLELARVDVSDGAALAALFADLEARWGGIDGVFHFAAKLSDEALCPLSELAPSAVNLNHGPKVQGAQWLAELAQRHRVGLCCLASSLSAEFGGIGNFGYAAANRALDVLAERLEAQCGTRWVSINFDYYRPQAAEDGRPDPRAHVQRLLGERALSGRDLWSVLTRALAARDVPQVLACAQPIELHIERYEASLRRRVHAERPDLPSLYRAPETALQKQLVEIWEELLNVSPVGVQDDFFQLGGDSLMVMRLIGRCRERLGLALSARGMIECRTIEQLCEHIARGETANDPLWLRQLPSPRHTLICVTYAGGTALAFQPLVEQLPADCAVLVLPPIREVDDEEALFARVKAQCRDVGTPFSVYGHCGGVFQAVELTRRLAAEGCAPARVFAAATLPPQSDTLLPEQALDSVLAGSNVLAFFDTLGGLPGAATETDARDAARAMREDAVRLTSLYQRFEREAQRARISVPLTCLIAGRDPLTSGWRERVSDWQRFFESVDWVELPDAGHYFVQSEPALVADVLRRTLGLELQTSITRGMQ